MNRARLDLFFVGAACVAAAAFGFRENPTQALRGTAAKPASPIVATPVAPVAVAPPSPPKRPPAETATRVSAPDDDPMCGGGRGNKWPAPQKRTKPPKVHDHG